MGSLTSAIADGSRVLLDSAAIVYYIERNPRYQAAAAELMQRVVDGRLSAAASVLALTEVLVPAYKAGNARAARQARSALERVPNLEFLEVDAAVADHASCLRVQHNLRTPDAIRAVTALESGCDWIVSNDRMLRRLSAEGIRVWLFDDHPGAAAAAGS